MKKFLIQTILLLGFISGPVLNSRADEGMWIPSLLQKNNEAEMQQMGLRLSAEDIYSINRSSLKDAVLLFGGGCTASFVSGQGLILTNHHCGFSEIQEHSSLEKDYLTQGFWAMRMEEELPNPGLTAELLVRMEDVTQAVLQGVTGEMGKKTRDSIIDANSKTLVKAATESTHFEARVRPFYYGNVYYLFVVEVFKDIRLVGAPPSSIGKFGGDTDNWMWPRHTGDFSVFRVYAGKDNKPADYSRDNVPYTPARVLNISLKGYEAGDFTFVYGYPGRTQQFITSWAVDMITVSENPAKTGLRTKRLEIIDRYVQDDPLTRIQYAAKSAGIANAWKKWIGESRGLKRLETANRKRQEEQAFQAWVNADPTRAKAYGGLLPAFRKTYEELDPVNLAAVYYAEAGLAIEMVRLAGRFSKLVNISRSPESKPSAVDAEAGALKDAVSGFFKNYNAAIDRELAPFLLTAYFTHCPQAYRPAILEEINMKYKGDFGAYADLLFSKSVFTSERKLNALLDHYRAGHYKKILKDPAFELASAITANYLGRVQGKLTVFRERIDSLQRIYVKALMEMKPDQRYYPDANLTLRVAYGQVKPYDPRDGVTYHYCTTLDGVLEKEDPQVADYAVSPLLKKLAIAGDFGPYACRDGKMNTCFIASNHTSGGNSGSPVFNAEGELIGLNFDRNWEGTMSDINYDPGQCRNITLDIRYCLWVIEKIGNAKHLIDEMKIVR